MRSAARRAMIGILAVSTILGGNTHAGDGLMVATFETDVTPPVGSVAPYGMSPSTANRFNRVTDPLYAKGLVILPEGQLPIILCVLDWVSLGDAGYDGFRDALAAAVTTTPQRVAVHVVHQHGAPAGGIGTEQLSAQFGAGGLHADVPFTLDAIARVGEAARAAVAQAVPATHVGVGKGRVEKVASTRRFIGNDGKLLHWRGSGPYPEPDRAWLYDLPEGRIDPDVRLVALWNGETPVAALTYYANHPMSFYGDGELSADFVGIARNLRDAAIPGIRHIFFNGGAGNIAPGKYNIGPGAASRNVLAQRLAEGMRLAWEQAVAARVPLAAGEVAWRYTPVRLPLQTGRSEAQMLALLASASDKFDKVYYAEAALFARRNAGANPDELARLTLGPAEIVHYPGEPFIEYQFAAQQMRPDRFVCFAGYGEYGPVYISTEAGHFQGGFETAAWCHTSVQAERVLLEATRELLDAPSPAPAQFSFQYGFEDANVSQGRRYGYRVRAAGVLGVSAYTDTAWASMPADGFLLIIRGQYSEN